MDMRKLFLIIVILAAKTVAGQRFKPTPDSCVVTVHFMSLEKIPYPGRLIVCNLENNKPFAGITDSLGRAEFIIPKDSSITFFAYNGSLLIGKYPFSFPNKPGLWKINYEIQEDFFNEDRTNEVLIDTTWASDRQLIPSLNMIEVEVNLTNNEGNPLPRTIILFRDSISKYVFIGETNDKGAFKILIPRDRQYGIRMTQLGNRIPFGDFSTKVDSFTTLLTLNLKFTMIEEKSYSEILREAFEKSEYQFLSVDNIPDLFTLENMYFDFDKSTLQPASYPELNNLVSVLSRFSHICVEIRGHTDNFGEDDYNQRLSDRRSATVRNYLIENGISSRRIQCKGLGEKLPVQSNETEAGRQANRRIEVKILSR
jgi:outer membrane protein OmpA-like peptidoglycan-associated protein